MLEDLEPPSDEREPEKPSGGIMKKPLAAIADQVTGQLSSLLGLEIAQVELTREEEGLPETVIKVSMLDSGKRKYPLMLKRQENEVAYCLYKQYLEPYHLNSPQEYGYIELDGQRFLVMDYIKHLLAHWEDRNSHLKAVKWLIKKDRISQQNMEFVKSLGCLGEMPYYGVEYWLAQFEKWYKDSPGNRLAEEVWACAVANRTRINEYIDALNEGGMQTVVHGNLGLDNILFGEGEADDDLLVIDWTQPHISSVTKDLVSLYDGAPDNLKKEIVETYRRQIDFYEFDAMFAKAKVLGDVGYLAWMAWMINGGEEMDQNELHRVATSFMLGVR